MLLWVFSYSEAELGDPLGEVMLLQVVAEDNRREAEVLLLYIQGRLCYSVDGAHS